jgi:hypothetical protein
MATADGVVDNDPGSRTLTVRPAPSASGTVKWLWREGVRAQGDPLGPTVWAAGAGERRVCFGQPTDDGGLKFHFPRGHPVYRQLVSTPGLRADIVVDMAGRQILGVTFKGRAWPGL